MAATESNPLILYDIPSKLQRKAWSPNTWKTRLVLNMKNIPYRTEWISYPDIEETFQRIGIEPTSKKLDGRDLYTCPAIIDPVSPEPKRIADSTPIAEYLEATYSDARFGPSFFPAGSKVEQLAFIEDILTPLAKTMSDLVLPLVPDILEDPRGSEYFMTTKRGSGGETLDLLCQAGSEARARALAALKAHLDLVARCYDAHPDGKNWLYLEEGVADGDGVTSVWDIIEPLNGGRWKELMDTFEPYLQVQ